ALVRKPSIFLLDEPLSHLDAELRSRMRAELKRLQKMGGSTMIYVTHDQLEAMTMADRIIVMNDGRFQQVGTPQTIFNEPANRFVAWFIGEPAMNLFRGIVKATERGADVMVNGRPFTSVDKILAAKLINEASGPNSEIEVGIRPPDLAVRR